MADRESLISGVRRKLVEGTEVLRTGGGTTLTASECNIILDAQADLTRETERLRDALERVYQTGRGPHVAIAREALNA
jgi:hypothetical protein